MFFSHLWPSSGWCEQDSVEDKISEVKNGSDDIVCKNDTIIHHIYLPCTSLHKTIPQTTSFNF
jgi:hypothetical protein